MDTKRRTALAVAIILAVSGCGGTRETSKPPVATSAAAATPTSTPTALQPTSEPPGTATPAIAPKAGEPWVVYRWPVVGSEDSIWLSRRDGNDRHQLVPELPGGQASPAWSPDGSRIVFAERTPAEAIWVVGSDGSDLHKIVSPISGCCGQDHPNWSSDGKSIAFMRWLGPEASIKSQLMVYDLGDGSLQVVATADAPLVLDHPRWSPDDKTLAVEVGRLASNRTDIDGGAIGLIPVATGKLELLTNFKIFAGYPTWRPDGKALAFDSYGFSYFRDAPAGEASDLFSIAVDGSKLRRLTDNKPGGRRSMQPAWLADGTIGYVDAAASWSDDVRVRFISSGGEALADSLVPIVGGYPRFIN